MQLLLILWLLFVLMLPLPLPLLLLLFSSSLPPSILVVVVPLCDFRHLNVVDDI